MLVTRLITGATCCITRRWIAGCANARRRKSSGSTTARRQSVSACMRTPSEPPVSAAIAPIQVGALWRPTGSLLPWSTIDRLRLAREQQLQPAVLLALLGDDLARRHAVGACDGDPLGELLVVRSSNRSTVRSSSRHERSTRRALALLR